MKSLSFETLWAKNTIRQLSEKDHSNRVPQDFKEFLPFNRNHNLVSMAFEVNIYYTRYVGISNEKKEMAFIVNKFTARHYQKKRENHSFKSKWDSMLCIVVWFWYRGSERRLRRLNSWGLENGIGVWMWSATQAGGDAAASASRLRPRQRAVFLLFLHH